MNIKRFSQRNYFLTGNRDGDEDYSQDNPLPITISAHQNLFSPSIKFFGHKNETNKFFLIITFISFKNIKAKSLKYEVKNKIVNINLDLDFPTTPNTQFCLTEVIIDVSQIQELQDAAQQNLSQRYVVNIDKPDIEENVNSTFLKYFGGDNGAGGTTDPINEFPFA